MKLCTIARKSGSHNIRYFTTFGSFRYKSELQGGEKFVELSAVYADAVVTALNNNGGSKRCSFYTERVNK